MTITNLNEFSRNLIKFIEKFELQVGNQKIGVRQDLEHSSSLPIGNQKIGVRQDLEHSSSLPFCEIYSDPAMCISLRSNVSVVSKEEVSSLLQHENSMSSSSSGLIYLPSVDNQTKNCFEDDINFQLESRQRFHRWFSECMKTKYVTKIKKFSDSRTVYQVDITDKQNISNSNAHSIHPDLINRFVSKGKSKFCHESFLISNFLDIIFAQVYDKKSHEKFNDWSSQIIEKAFSDDRSNDLFSGFCYETFHQLRFFEKPFSCGPAPILLLALTRGFNAFFRNIVIEPEPVPPVGYPSTPKSPFHGLKGKFGFDFIPTITDNHEKGKKKPSPKGKLIYVKELADINKFPTFLRADEYKITLRAENLPWQVIALLVLMVVFMLTYAITIGRHSSIATFYGVIHYIGELAEVFSGVFTIFSIVFLVLRRVFAMRTDILQSRREVENLKELSSNLQGKKTEAIELLASLKGFKNIVSSRNSCAFEEGGEGCFEINQDIFVRELEKIGYVFGVDNYGTMVVGDLKGRIRRINVNKSKRNTIHLGKEKANAIKFIYELETKNFKVGDETEEDTEEEALLGCENV